MIVFSKQWFKKYNKQLCWLANSFVGDFVFKISKMGHDKKKYGKITEMHPNAITHKQRLLYDFEKKKLEQEYTTQFFSRNEYALRLQKIFYPIWLLFHGWDMLIANKFKPAWNLGFDTLTAYPDAGTGNTTVDGTVLRYATGSTWSSLRDGAGNQSYDEAPDITFCRVTCYSTSNQYSYLTRAIFTFDTSSIGAGDISSTVLSIYGNGKADTFTTPAAPTLNIYTSTPANDNALVNADYSQIGITAQCDTVVTYASFNTSGYNNFTLNSTGKGNVNKTGISRFGARGANYDVADVAPTWESSKYFYLKCYFADNGSNKPKLVVTYSVAAAEEDNSIFFGCNF